MSSNIVISKVKEWLTPALILIVSFFIKTWMNSVDTKLDQLTSLQTTVATIAVKVDTNARDIASSKSDVKDLQISVMHCIEARKEDEVTVDNLKHKY